MIGDEAPTSDDVITIVFTDTGDVASCQVSPGYYARCRRFRWRDRTLRRNANKSPMAYLDAMSAMHGAERARRPARRAGCSRVPRPRSSARRSRRATVDSGSDGDGEPPSGDGDNESDSNEVARLGRGPS